MRSAGVRLLYCRAGVTYLLALMMVMVLGIMLAKVGQSWQQLMQREKEEELLFRGSQMQDALTRWYRPQAGQQVATPLTDLKQLLRDPRTAATVRYLRREYRDPITGKEWVLIRDPTGGIIGVSSSSDQKPIKQDYFPDNLKEFTNKKSYREWQFLARTTVTAPTGQDLAPTPIGAVPLSERR